MYPQLLRILDLHIENKRYGSTRNLLRAGETCPLSHARSRPQGRLLLRRLMGLKAQRVQLKVASGMMASSPELDLLSHYGQDTRHLSSDVSDFAGTTSPWRHWHDSVTFAEINEALRKSFTSRAFSRSLVDEIAPNSSQAQFPWSCINIIIILCAFKNVQKSVNSTAFRFFFFWPAVVAERPRNLPLGS